MAFGREAGTSKHVASTAGGQNVRECQKSTAAARKAADRQADTGVGPARNLGEVARHRPMLAGPRGMRDSPRHSRKGWMASVLDLHRTSNGETRQPCSHVREPSRSLGQAKLSVGARASAGAMKTNRGPISARLRWGAQGGEPREAIVNATTTLQFPPRRPFLADCGLAQSYPTAGSGTARSESNGSWSRARTCRPCGT